MRMPLSYSLDLVACIVLQIRPLRQATLKLSFGRLILGYPKYLELLATISVPHSARKTKMYWANS